MPKLSPFVLRLVPELFVALVGNATASVLPPDVSRRVARGALEAAGILEDVIREANEGATETDAQLETRALRADVRAVVAGKLPQLAALFDRLAESVPFPGPTLVPSPDSDPLPTP